MQPTRRTVLGALSASALAIPSFAKVGSHASTAPGSWLAPVGGHEIVPLSFDPKKLRELSEKLILSHHGNNYAGAIKSLNRVEAEIAKLGKDTPPFVVSGLKERELQFRNSAAYHELYFGNLGGDGADAGEMKGPLTTAFGSMAAFEESFRAVGTSLGGGSGWTVLGFDFHRGTLAISWAGNHTQAMTSTFPLLVMDMYEHAYAIDFGAAAARYIEAFFKNIDWAVVAKRYAVAKSAYAVMTGGR